MNAVRVSGTTDPAEIAAVLAALGSMRPAAAPMTGYERWRLERINALRRAARRRKPLHK